VAHCRRFEYWAVVVINREAEHYGKSERISLYRSLIDDLPWHFKVATSNLSKVLEQLGTPLEIQKFFDALPTIDIDHRHNPKALINEAVRKAHHESIERTVIDQIEERRPGSSDRDLGSAKTER
jgi:hypothetical protein